jgi:hypothetical protein
MTSHRAMEFSLMQWWGSSCRETPARGCLRPKVPTKAPSDGSAILFLLYAIEIIDERT